MGSAAAVHPRIDRGACGQDHRRDDHHHHGSYPRLRRYVRRRAEADPDRLRPVDRLRRVELLPVLLLLRRRGARLMASQIDNAGAVPGYAVPVHRGTTEHILPGGAPPSTAIFNGTLTATLGTDPAPGEHRNK